ncbi:hypothetical protein Asp14428_12230 [Actinoplanes sp. NBRC 14428]|nr:hypothetical protein Asp14428_12230 [Actinoplanes sp. NBRC 14428]
MESLAGRYRLEEAVGRGGSAVVHRGYDRTLKRRIAVKLFSPYRPDGNGPAVDVLREARAAARLSHPNIARVYDYGEAIDGDERVPYLILEFLEGDTLADELARTGALDWRRAAAVCADTAAALAAAHERDLVHRDVKPRNVMLTPAGVKVLDFGIAAAAGQSSFDTHGQLWGTPANLAPEQLRGEPTYPAADVYALGLMLFECLTGTRAWPGSTVGEILAARHEGRTARLPRIPGLPREINRLYEACVADDQARRPTAAAAAEILRRAAGSVRSPIPAATSARRATTTRSRRRGAASARPAPTAAAAAAHPASTVAAATRPVAPTAATRPVLPRRAALTAAIAGAAQPARPRRAALAASIAAAHLAHPRHRAAVTASLAVVLAVVSVLGLQLANGGATPGGRPADAAVDGAGGAGAVTPMPRPSTASPTTTAPIRDIPVDDVERQTRTRTATTNPVYQAPPPANPTTRPTTRPTTTPPAAPSSSPPRTPSQPPPTSSEPKPSDPPVTTTPPTETTSPPTNPDPDPTTPESAATEENIVLAGLDN